MSDIRCQMLDVRCVIFTSFFTLTELKIKQTETIF